MRLKLELSPELKDKFQDELAKQIGEQIWGARIEDIGTQIHTGNLEELKDLLGTWSDEDKLNILLEGIAFNELITPNCNCVAHKLKAYAESDGNQ
jgi:hypothetical protein